MSTKLGAPLFDGWHRCCSEGQVVCAKRCWGDRKPSEVFGMRCDPTPLFSAAAQGGRLQRCQRPVCATPFLLPSWRGVRLGESVGPNTPAPHLEQIEAGLSGATASTVIWGTNINAEALVNKVRMTVDG